MRVTMLDEGCSGAREGVSTRREALAEPPAHRRMKESDGTATGGDSACLTVAFVCPMATSFTTMRSVSFGRYPLACRQSRTSLCSLPRKRWYQSWARGCWCRIEDQLGGRLAACRHVVDIESKSSFMAPRESRQRDTS